MRISPPVLRARHAALLCLLCVATPATADVVDRLTFSNVRIDNFGQINDRYYRGAQPDPREIQGLAAAGIKTVIDLTRNGQAAEQRLVEAAGMTYHRIPLTTTARPLDAAVAEFLSLVTNPALQPVYVHCREGRHRTGVMTAVYRMTQDGWTADQAYAEMKKYRFEGFLGHPALKQFVYEYFPAFRKALPAQR